MVSDVSRMIVLSRAAITGGEGSRRGAAPLTEQRSACVCVEAVYQLS